MPPLHELPFTSNSKEFFIGTIPVRIVHTTVSVAQAVKHLLEREIAH